MAIGQQVTIPPIPHGSLIEKIIVGRLVDDLRAAGYKLRVYDGEEYATGCTRDPAIIYAAMAATDQDRLDLFKEGKHVAWVLLIWGNDGDIISDYSTNLEPIIKPIYGWIDTLEAR